MRFGTLMKRILVTLGILGLSVAAFSLGAFFKVASETYRFPVDSPASKAKCQLCHVGKLGGKLNGYGLDLKAALNGSKRITPAILHSIDNLKSGRGDQTNGELLRAGSLPVTSPRLGRQPK